MIFDLGATWMYPPVQHSFLWENWSWIMRCHHESTSRIKWDLTVVGTLTNYSPNETKDIYCLFQNQLEPNRYFSCGRNPEFFLTWNQLAYYAQSKNIYTSGKRRSLSLKRQKLKSLQN